MSDIREKLLEALTRAGAVSCTLEHPSDPTHGDLATNAAFVLAKKEGTAPRECAKRLLRNLSLPPEVAQTEIAGAGFINFFLSRDFFSGEIGRIRDAQESWGRNDIYEGKRVIVEYTDPNPFKELHIGHLVPNAVGESLARLFMDSGAEVRRVTFQGDVGLHVAKAIWGMQKLAQVETASDLGKAYALGAKAYEEGAKEEMQALNKVIYEKSDPEINALYEKGKALSLQYFEEAYALLGSEFDRYFFESETGPRGLEIVRAHIGSVFQESDGAVIFPGEKYGLHTRVFVNAEGLPTYEAKDLGLVEEKHKYFPFDLSVTVTASEQKEYFKVVLKALEEVLPQYKGKIEVLTNGMLRLKEGKMSSRTGDVISALSLIEEVAKRVSEKAEEGGSDISEEVLYDIAVGAIKYAILRSSTEKDIVFDFKQSITFEGDSGPYLQYTYARSRSVLEKAKDAGVSGSVAVTPEGPYPLERILYRFPQIVERAVSEREPHHVATFLVEVAGAFNTFYGVERIVDPEDRHAPYKVLLTEAVAATLKNGLWLLGIRAPERM